MTHHARGYHRALRLCPETLPSRVRACVAVREQDGRIYFYNAVTQVTQWEAPPDLLSAAPAAASAARAPDEWQQTTRSARSFLTRCSVLVCAWGVCIGVCALGVRTGCAVLKTRRLTLEMPC
jgi:hypothetical protein